MSNIRTLYGSLADLDMSFTKEGGGTHTVTGYDLHELKKAYERPDVPARILLPMEEYNGANPGVSEPMNAGSSGVGGEMVWNVVDLLLFKSVGQDIGLLAILPDLVRYAGNYVEKMMDNVQLTTNFRLQTVTPQMGVYEFPLASGKQYYGVEGQLTWIELINPGG